jgi:D-alanyl-D-alanine carboxypeptidase (penicillin-binding protein 5/6)
MQARFTIPFQKPLVLLAILAGATLCAAQESHVIFDNQTGRILASKNPEKKLPVASLTKIATAIVALDWADLHNVNLADQVVVPLDATADGLANPIGLQPGDSLSIRDLIYCALMASDNVSANSLAAHIGAKIPNPNNLAPRENFVAQMNALARNLLMKRTLFLNPTGADHRTDTTTPHSTAGDMARLTRHAMQKASFAFYVEQKSRQIHIFRNGIDHTHEIHNTNELLGQAGIDGVKTGRTRKAGDCLVLSSQQAPESRREGEQVFITPRRISVVLLRSPDRFRDGLNLVRQGWGLYDAWVAEGRPVKPSNAL